MNANMIQTDATRDQSHDARTPETLVRTNVAEESMLLGDTRVTVQAIDGKDLRDGDVIVHPSGQFAPVKVTRVVRRDEYAVMFRAQRVLTIANVTKLETIATCASVANLARLHVERAS